MPNFETSVALACSPEAAFDFIARPENIAKISPSNVGLHFVNAPEVIEQGSRVEFKVQGWGMVQQGIHEITVVERPHRFIEHQVKGPFKLWVHEHLFSVDAEGKTLLTDLIEFEPPAGLLGMLVTKAKILDHLEDAFHHRHVQLRKLLEGS